MSAISPTETIGEREKSGDFIGRYKLIEKIGEGGCGVVYMAEQVEPVHRRVALKVIKPGMDTDEVIARFEVERQALALMEHPNIAKVLDAGATDSGRPYFVMELVRGMRITGYCDQKNLSTRQRLDLFAQVCHAVQHAHQKGIIHRDLKPSNILVTVNDGAPVPKVIDFGIAKAIGQSLTDKTLFTKFHQFLGTPAYTSPEQAEMTCVDVDTRSDIYSLGVLLYELLIGRTPFDGSQLLRAGLDEMRRIIREQEPPKPSTRLSTMTAADLTEVARYRQCEPARLTHLVRGDLDWIVMKCLEKDRTRRYETANGIAIDVKRHLTNEPVLASPPGQLYRFQKMVRRNKHLFAAVGAVTTALLAGLIVSSWLFFKERTARQRITVAEETEKQLRKKAELEAENARQTVRFVRAMLDDIAASAAVLQDRRTLQQTLANAVQRVRKELQDQPLVQARLLGELGMMYSDLKENVLAWELLREASSLLPPSTNAPDVALASSLSFDLGRVLAQEARWPLAEEALQRALDVPPLGIYSNDAPDRARVLRQLIEVQRRQGHFSDAEATVRVLLGMPARATNDWPTHAWPVITLADLLEQQGKVEECERVWRDLLALLPSNATNYNANQFAAGTRRSFVEFLIRSGQYPEAEIVLLAEVEESVRFDRHRGLADWLVRMAWQERETNPPFATRCAIRAETLTRPDLVPPKFEVENGFFQWLCRHVGSALLARALVDRELSADQQAKLIEEARPLVEHFLDQCEESGFDDTLRLQSSREVTPALENIRALGEFPVIAQRYQFWSRRAADLLDIARLHEEVEQLCRDGRWAEAEKRAKLGVAAERRSGTARPALVQSLCLLASVLCEQQKLSEAEGLLVEAFALAESPRRSWFGMKRLTKDALENLFAANEEGSPQTPRGRELAARFRFGPSYQSIPNACMNDLLKLNRAKKNWAHDFNKGPDDVPMAAQLYGPNSYLRQRLQCRGGGTYTIGPVKEPPYCSTHGPAYNSVLAGAYDFKWVTYVPGAEAAACRTHLTQLREAKRIWARENRKQLTDVPERSEIFGPNRRIKSDSRCPSGGIYMLGAVNELPSCSNHGWAPYL